MENRTKRVLGMIVVNLCVGLVLWPQEKLPPASGVQATFQPAGVTSTAIGPQRKFAEMGVLERNAIKNEIAKQDLPMIFQAMLDAERVEHDPMKQMHLQTVLSGALRLRKPSPEFLEMMRAFVTNNSNSKFERQLLIGALHSAATRETVDLMIQVATTSPDPEIRQSAGALAGAGDLGGAGAKLSPSLERVWRESSNRDMLFSVAVTMAKIGAPSGIELLLTAALATDGKDGRRASAQSALQEAYLPNAVPPLATRLANQSTTSAAAKLIAPILVKIGDATASKAVVGWLELRAENAGPVIQDLIRQRTRSEPMLSAWTAALNPAVPFRNEQNREAIRAGLAAYRAGRTSQP